MLSCSLALANVDPQHSNHAELSTVSFDKRISSRRDQDTFKTSSGPPLQALAVFLSLPAYPPKRAVPIPELVNNCHQNAEHRSQYQDASRSIKILVVEGPQC